MSMMFKHLPGFETTPAGKERDILRWLPKILVAGSLLLALPSLAVRLLDFAEAPSTLVSTVDIYAISLLVLHWTVVFTVAIGAFIVLVMKGPAYVADAYPLDDADAPD